MDYQQLSAIKHRITLTGEEVALLRDRLVPISPLDYDLRSFSLLRNLYGRLDRITVLSQPYPSTKEVV